MKGVIHVEYWSSSKMPNEEDRQRILDVARSKGVEVILHEGESVF